MLTVVEVALVLALTLVGFGAPGLGARWFQAVERPFAHLARKRRLVILIVALPGISWELTMISGPSIRRLTIRRSEMRPLQVKGPAWTRVYQDIFSTIYVRNEAMK